MLLVVVVGCRKYPDKLQNSENEVRFLSKLKPRDMHPREKCIRHPNKYTKTKPLRSLAQGSVLLNVLSFKHYFI